MDLSPSFPPRERLRVFYCPFPFARPCCSRPCEWQAILSRLRRCHALDAAELNGCLSDGNETKTPRILLAANRRAAAQLKANWRNPIACCVPSSTTSAAPDRMAGAATAPLYQSLRNSKRSHMDSASNTPARCRRRRMTSPTGRWLETTMPAWCRPSDMRAACKLAK